MDTHDTQDTPSVVTTPPPRRRRWLRRLLWAGLVLAALLVADWLAACWLLWSSYQRLVAALRTPSAAFGSAHTFAMMLDCETKHPSSWPFSNIEVWAKGDVLRLRLGYRDYAIGMERGEKTALWAEKSRVVFMADREDFAETQRALSELAEVFPQPCLLKRAGLAVVIHPLVIP
ncbi:MAG: hypothetical protein FJ272_11155, partial [Planctomycetes bacterium]|nr:hypothetical protein [Planctomycetota bacterium]